MARSFSAEERARAGARLQQEYEKHTGGADHYDPIQPRVPTGHPDGGQWTRSSAATSAIATEDESRDNGVVMSDATPGNDWMPGAQYAQYRPRGFGPILINGRPFQITPGQASRLSLAEARAKSAIDAVRTIDRNWQPTRSWYESVEGRIAATEAEAREAEAKRAELAYFYLLPGPYAQGSIPARGTGRDLTQAEREVLNHLGYRYGCNSCGIKTPGTLTGNFVGDHHPPTALNYSGRAQRLFPQCIVCMREQGLAITIYKRSPR